MKTVLHISADFPDPLVPGKTRAVVNLLQATANVRHVVYSLNRHSGVSGLHSVPFGPDRLAIAYSAPPYGIGLERFLRPVADVIARHVDAVRLQPDLIHAHKLTVDGLVAAAVAERLKIPYIASVWGDTDGKIIGVKRGLRARFRDIATKAERLLPATPWAAALVEDTLAVPRDRIAILPVITAGDAIIRPQLVAADNLISVFSLDAWKRKGLDVLASAMAKVAARRPDAVLDVFGAGSPRALFAVARILRRTGAGNIRLRGALPHHHVQQAMNEYAAFVMAPRRETYGMVHVEAVLAGLPVLWARARGIDGLLDPHVGCRCDPESAAEVADGIAYLLANQKTIKTTIARLQGAGEFRRLQRDSIARVYSGILDAAVPDYITTGRGQRGGVSPPSAAAAAHFHWSPARCRAYRIRWRHRAWPL